MQGDVMDAALRPMSPLETSITWKLFVEVNIMDEKKANSKPDTMMILAPYLSLNIPAKMLPTQ